MIVQRDDDDDDDHDVSLVPGEVIKLSPTLIYRKLQLYYFL